MIPAMLAIASNTFLTTAEVLGLLTACPWTQSNPVDCRLHEMRKIPLAELYAMIRHASSDELLSFAEVCHDCPQRCPRRARSFA